jgi:hypothetical protein
MLTDLLVANLSGLIIKGSVRKKSPAPIALSGNQDQRLTLFVFAATHPALCNEPIRP